MQDPFSTETEGKRRRVYGRRRGKKLRPGHRRLIADVLPRLSLSEDALAPGTNPARLFDRQVEDVWLEIGFGKGEHLSWQAINHPAIGFIGCEPFIDGVASLLADIERHDLSNLRIVADDARLLLDRLADASLARVFLLFPDPWPKTRHHKRRFVQADTLDILARRMKPGAELRIATDHADYAVWILSHMNRRPEFEWLIERPADCHVRSADWPPTRYEEKALKQGRSAVYLRYRRR